MYSVTSSLGALAAAAFLLPASCLCQGPSSGATEGTAHSLGAARSLTSVHMKDEYLSPLIYRGWIPTAALTARRSTTSSRQELQLSFGVGHIDSRLLPRDVTEHLGALTYAYMRALRTGASAGSSLALFLGGGVSSRVSQTDFDATDHTTGYTYYDRSWYWSHALDLDLEAEYQISERRAAVARLTAPVVRLVSRPKNGHDLNTSNAHVIRDFLSAAKGGTAVGLWQDPALGCRVSYRQNLGARTSFEVGYTFEYAASSTPMRLRMYTEGFQVTLTVGNRSP